MRRRATALVFVLFVSASFAAEPPSHFSKSRTGMAASGSTYATAAGVRMLEQGGNAVDAAAAAAFALMVTDPANTSIGGRVQALVRLNDGRIIAIDGATQVPAGFIPKRDKSETREGWAIISVPGAPAALEHMVRQYGKKTLAQVLEPAIQLAAEGFAVPPRLARTWSSMQQVLRRDPGAAANFLKADGSPYQAGEIFRQPRLAAVLRDVASVGTAILYRGRIAKAIARSSEAKGGYIRAADLAGYRVEPGKLTRTNYRNCEVVTAGARKWGSTLHEMLKALNRSPLGASDPTADEVETMAAAVSQGLAAKSQGGEPHDTSHLSVMDREGNAVALTTSIGPSFGSHVASPSLGFLYAHSYRMESNGTPGERDMTEMSPTIVFRDGRPFLVVGGAGSERIPSAVLQVISNVVDRHMSLEQAVRAPRLFPAAGQLRLHDGFAPSVIEALRARSFSVEKVELGATLHLGLVHAVSFDPATGEFSGAADLGDSGSAAAPAGSRP